MPHPGSLSGLAFLALHWCVKELLELPGIIRIGVDSSERAPKITIVKEAKTTYLI